MNIDLSNFKFSKFNHKMYLKNELYLYNSFTGGFGKVEDNNKHFFDKSSFNSNNVPNELLNNSLLDSLLAGGFIVYKDIDENKKLEAIHNMGRFGNSKGLGITILPTIDCNFRCTYCFEQDREYPSGIMDSNIIEKTLTFINENVSDDGYLNVSWFGGEPLLAFNVIKEIQSELNKTSNEKGITISSGIVTNGYLLTERISNELVDLGIDTAQITLDGSSEIHNKKRKLINGMGTYDKIVNNILKSNNELNIVIRMNVDKTNIDNVSIFLDSLQDKGVFKKGNVSVYFSIVRDYDTSKPYLSQECYDTQEFSGEKLKLHRIAQKKNIKTVNISEISPNMLGCGAVSPRTFVIEPDGLIQKCWQSVGDKDHAVGHLLPEENEKRKDHYLSNQYKWYSWHGYNKNECKNCDVLPLCMGGCPYFDLYPSDFFENSEYNCTTLKYNMNGILEHLALNK